MSSQGVWNEELDKWVRRDKKECCICKNSHSTSPELFKVKFAEGEDLIYCNVCLGEGPLSEVPDEIKSMTKVETTSIKKAPQDKEKYSAEWLNNNKDIEGNEIDWVDSETLKEMKQFREEKLTNLMESLNLLHDNNKLEAFIAILTEEQRDKLYSHPYLLEFDLLP